MLPAPSLEEQANIAETLRRPRLSLNAREIVGEGLFSVALAAAVAIVWWRSPPGSFSIVAAVVCVLVFAVAARIRIDTPFGCTTPTELAFVPLLFALPGALVPIAVVLAWTLARLPGVVSGEMRASRLVHSIPNAWFAVGPIAVFAIARVAPDKASAGVLVAALAAQFIVDFVATGVRYAIVRGATIAEHVRGSWVWVVDGALSVVSLLAAEQIHRTPAAALAPLPLLGLVALFARERRQRLESLIELNGAYRRARDEAIEASNLKSAFLRNVSHEIRTPMNGVLGMNELLLATNLTDEQHSYAQQVEASGEHMLAVINDILDISKIESGRIDIDPVDFDLRETVEQACAPADLEAGAKGLELDIEIDRRTPEMVRGDRARVRQVLMNLAGNAVKFTAKGGATVRVTPTGQGHIRFEVSDTGVGIDATLIERMFEPFVQADVSMTRQFGGNGLGLAIAKELVELMGGAIGASSEVGAGSTFWFELPLPSVAAALPSSPRDDPNHLLRARRVDADAALVLIVEDSPVNRLVAAHVLERLGYRSHVVNDGREALQALASQHYDAVLMDCQMPDIDGYEATRELRRREQGLRRTPVIAMTAHAMTGDRAKCLEAGMDDYITKPVRSQTLAEVLRRWIEASERRSLGSPTGSTARGRRTLAERAAARAHTISRH
jgi:signal transduction histidine kinase/CheY-like chemotaxis protein